MNTSYLSNNNNNNNNSNSSTFIPSLNPISPPQHSIPQLPPPPPPQTPPPPPPPPLPTCDVHQILPLLQQYMTNNIASIPLSYLEQIQTQIES